MMMNLFAIAVSVLISALPPLSPGDTLDTCAAIRRTFKSDISYAGLPWISAGILLRSKRKDFRNARNKFLYQFHNTADNYTQYAPLALSTALKIAGYEGRSRWGRYLFSSTMSYAAMALLVNGIKYTAHELRPDGSTSNSFPSGHTATAFTAATILHKEYGLTRSPWFSIAGYTLATVTGCMRVLNNRHWISDTFAGAGIGILSAELGYAIGDLVFKNKGLARNDIAIANDLMNHPSFFSVYMGWGLGRQSLTLPVDNLYLDEFYDFMPDRKLKFSKATVVGVEGAYFPNRHIGFGGRFRVRSQLIKNWDTFAQNPFGDLAAFDPRVANFMESYVLEVKSDHLSEFTTQAGGYFNFPVRCNVVIGTKVLVGGSYMRGINIDAIVKGKKRAVDMSYDMSEGRKLLTFEIQGDMEEGERYAARWDYFTLDGSPSVCLGTGLSLTFSYKALMAWRLFFDCDYTQKKFGIAYAPTQFIKTAASSLTFEGRKVNPNDYIRPYTAKLKKNLITLVVGGAFCISF